MGTVEEDKLGPVPMLRALVSSITALQSNEYCFLLLVDKTDASGYLPVGDLLP